VIREENKLQEKLKALFAKRFKKVMSQLKEDGLPSSEMQRKILLSPIVSMTDEYTDTVIEGTQEALNNGRRGIFNKLKQIGYLKVKKAKIIKPKLPIITPLEVAFSDFSPELLKIIRNKTFIASQGTMDRIIGDIMINLGESYEQGLGIKDAAGRLNDVFTSMETFETERIARTEINQAQNRGAYFTEQELAVDYHMWWTAGDSKVRGTDPKDTADHVILHGQIVRVGKPFSNGLLFPGDTSGDIAQWIQCRCREIPFLMPEGYTAPIGMLYFYEEDLIPIE
jgi:uncharacterized protein with gpF-like domain